MYRNSNISTSVPVLNNYNGTDDNPPSNGKTWSLFGWPLGGDKKEIRELDTERAKSPSEEFVFTVPKDPFLSPYLASDDLLARLPPTKILVSLWLLDLITTFIIFVKR